MTPEQRPITGNDAIHPSDTPLAALNSFYDAFNSRSLEKMSNNWAQTDDIIMNNPLGGIKRGWPEIREVYYKIFSGQASIHVEFFDYTIDQTAEMFFAVGRERGNLRKGDEELNLAIRTTRIFRVFDGRWRQVHHHGSIDDPALLSRYRAAVTGK